MDTVGRGHSNSVNGLEVQFEFNQHSLSAPSDRDLVRGCQLDGRFGHGPAISNVSSLPGSVSPCEGDNEVECDYFDGVFKYIQQMLMEEDLEDRSCMFQDCLALQAAEKVFYEVLNEDCSSACGSPAPSSSFVGVQSFDNPKDDFANIWKNDNGIGFSAVNDSVVHHRIFQPNFRTLDPDTASSLGNVIDGMLNPSVSPSLILESPSVSRSQPACKSRGFSCSSRYNPLNKNDAANQGLESNERTCKIVAGETSNSGDETSNELREKIGHSREYTDHDVNKRSNKQLASYTEEIEKTEVYDDVLLCPDRNPNFYGEFPDTYCTASSEKEGANKQLSFQPKTAKRGRPRACDKKCNIREIVDLRDLLTRCAHAVASYDNRSTDELLKQIRQHASPYGDATERLAHCLANALEARIAGMGSALYTSLTAKRASAADILKAYQTYATICPFQRMSNIFANKSIGRLTSSATRIHIIDFGILYGFQWPCILHGISLRPGGPPKLRITGIDLPQPGFRPAQRVEETGRHLASFAKRFDVPFEFSAIAKRWNTISIEDLKIDKDEMLVVNCLYRLRNVPDETLEEISPRNAVINLIRNLNPDYFVHGILNAGYNAPFFETRFKEALYHFSSLFDMFQATLPLEDQERLMFEKEVLGRDAMNVIACEGAERVERPDTYKQWQVRIRRAGFRQLPLNQEIMREIKVKVKLNYHKEFLVDEDSNWMLQGWKGRVLYAISCWKPARK